MYKCGGCGSVSKPGEPRNTWVAETRRRRYALMSKKGERLGVTTGEEIVREVGLCSSCFGAAQQADEYRETSDGS